MIKSLIRLKGLPGDQPDAIEPYSMDGHGLFREGVVMEFVDENETWIGNFQPAGSCGHHLFPTGIAAVTAGPHCYLIKNRRSRPTIVSSQGAAAWSDFRVFEHENYPYLLLIDSRGYLACLNELGTLVGSTHLDEPCENACLDRLGPANVEGSYYDFSLKKKISFDRTLPDLTYRHA